MAYPVMPIGLLGGQGDADPYRIERSLRFNSASGAYFNRTFTSPTNQSIFTLSFWMKLGVLGTTRTIFGVSTNHSLNLTTGNALNLTFAGTSALTTTTLLRDPSAWYHIVWTQNGNAHTIYINGASVGTATATSNTFNTGVQHQIGGVNTANFFDGYLTEIHFIDGQALTPLSFCETDPISGRYRAKSYTGTYGVNGFFLNFSDTSDVTATTLGRDFSGNTNNWAPSGGFNIGGSSGVAVDNLVDSPSNYGVDNGNGGEVRGNYATLNPISHIRGTISFGNLRTNGGDRGSVSTIGLSSGKWYCELFISYYGAESSFGISSGLNIMNTMVGDSSDSIGFQFLTGDFVRNNINIDSGSTPNAGETCGLELDLESNPNTLKFIYKVGSVWLTKTINLNYYSIPKPIFIAASGRTTTAPNDVYLNFGQRPFFIPITNNARSKQFKALCSTNLPTPVVRKSTSAMDVVTYTGNASTRSFSNIGFPPDLVWIKSRSAATDHAIYDSVRGAQKDLGSNLTTDETVQSQGVTSFDNTGFSIGNLAKINTNSATYVAWTWDRSATDGVDIVSYTGSGSARTIAHGLGSAPRMIIVKARTTAGTDQGWPVYHASNGTDAETDYLSLHLTNATADDNTYWNDTVPTSSVFSLGTNAAVNQLNDTYIAYLFSEIDGFSSIRSYTGNGLADGPFVWCGFRPAFLMIKRTNLASNWVIFDKSRLARNVDNEQLYPNLANVEATTDLIDLLSNGFKVRSTDASINASAAPYVYIAFAESPFKYARAR
ncbi:MAG: LamG domain-containing protein [Alphaproteobacteria bacterium]|nr:LamG domain-containing protein [Alphaproteobacteria bacterium]